MQVALTKIKFMKLLILITKQIKIKMNIKKPYHQTLDRLLSLPVEAEKKC